MQRLKFSLFSQYLISYVIVLCLPILVIGSLVYSNFISIMENQVLKDNQRMLLQIKDSVDLQMRQISNISVQISSKPDLTPASLENFYNAFKARSLLGYTEGNEFIYELLFHIRGSNYMFSAKSSYTLPLFFESQYFYKEWPYADIVTQLNTVLQPELRPAEDVLQNETNNQRFITILAPIPTNSITPYGTAMFMIKEKALKNMLSAILKDREGQGNAVIFDNSGNIITALETDDALFKSAYRKSIQTTRENENVIMRLENKDYYVSFVKSKETGWTYLTLIPESALMGPIHSIRTKTVIGLIVILLMGSLLIYYGMSVNYRPIRQLIRNTEQKWGQLVGQIHGIDKVHLAMEHAESENRRLQNQMKISQPVLHEHVLLRLLKGHFTDILELNAIGETCGIRLSLSVFYVAMLQFDQADPETLQRCTDTVRHWSKSIDERMDLYVVHLNEEQRLVLIISSEPNEQVTESGWHKLQKDLKDEHGTLVTIGIGEMYPEIGDIGKSYIEASSAIIYKMIKGNHKVIFFKETNAGNLAIRRYPKKNIEYLGLYAKQREVKQFQACVEDLVRQIRQNSTTLFMAKFLSFDIINTIMKSMDDFDTAHAGESVEYPDVLKLTDYNDIEDLVRIVTEVCASAYKRMEAIRPDNHEQKFDLIMKYINEQYTSYQFSVHSMSDDLKMSTSYLGRHFKDRTGNTISDYVNELRIVKAKQALIETDLQLQDIVSQVGYADVSSFIRKFKQSVSMTPGEYRKKYGKNAG